MIINDAVNICLKYILETPVPDGVDIDSLDPLHEAYVIRESLLANSRRTQTKGWWFNVADWTFIPDGAGRIGLSPAVLSNTTDNDYIKEG